MPFLNKDDYKAHFTCEIKSTRAGESDSAISIDRKPFEFLACKISQLTRHPGIWGIDLKEDNGTFYVIDVNPRFSGDYPFHHLAGCNIPKALIYWVTYQEPTIDCFIHHTGIFANKDLITRISPR